MFLSACAAAEAKGTKDKIDALKNRFYVFVERAAAVCLGTKLMEKTSSRPLSRNHDHVEDFDDVPEGHHTSRIKKFQVVFSMRSVKRRIADVGK